MPRVRPLEERPPTQWSFRTILSHTDLLQAARAPIFHVLRGVCGSALISTTLTWSSTQLRGRRAREERFEKFFREFQSVPNSPIDVIALLKVYVLE